MKPSTSYRVPSGSSRNTSGSSLSTNGTRPPSVASNYRPQSALAHARTVSNGHRPLAQSNHNFEDDDEDDDEDSAGSRPVTTRRKGTHLFSISALHQQDRLRPKRQRKHEDDGAPYIPDSTCNTASRSQSPFRKVIAEKEPFRNISLSTAFEGLRLQSDCAQPRDSMFPCFQQNQDCPPTPSHIPKLHSRALKPVQTPQVVRTPRTRYKINHESPTKFTFLTRDSNTPAPAWDTKGRLEDMELLYSQLKDQFQGAAYEKTGLEETLSLYKMRREWIVTVVQFGTNGTLYSYRA